MNDQKTSEQIIIYPTDTVWGIGGSIFHEEAYNQIAHIKKTRFDKPLSIMFPNVKLVMEYFNLPLFMNEKWLSDYFSLESTLGLKTNRLKKQLPEWLVNKSEYLSIRCLENEVTKKVYDLVSTPFFTTSLNLTGNPPIVSQKEALEFKNQYAPDATIISAQKELLSGESSTIIFFDETSFRLIRKGNHLSSLEKLIAKEKFVLNS